MLSEGVNGYNKQGHTHLASKYRLDVLSSTANGSGDLPSAPSDLEALLLDASALARPPVSSYHVGAVGVGGSGRLYLGCNVEFAGLPLNFSIHAEQFLLINLLHAGERQLRKLVVSAAPCGHCRQFFAEVSGADSMDLIFGASSRKYKLADLLPHRFGPEDLLEDAAERLPLLLEEQPWSLRLTEGSRQEVDGMDEEARQLAWAAVEAASSSYCPYSRQPSGVALKSAGGFARGEYVESAAFNPTLSPLHTALVDAVIHGLQDWSAIKSVVLVELSGGTVSQAAVMRTALAVIAPQAAFRVLSLQMA